MSLDLTPDQILQLQSLGIDVSKSHTNISEEIKTDHIFTPKIDKIVTPSKPSTRSNTLLPLLSISGLTFLSFGGLILFKNKTTVSVPPDLSGRSTSQVDNVPTQVPKSIQHYLLTSQQFFTQALEAQNTKNPEAVNYLNQSILAATEAIKTFPSDSRAYEQRGRIYTSLIDSQPQLLTSAISDLSAATRLNPESAEITRTLATLYAKKGDSQNTLTYLSQTVNLEPTKAQNFYDLARLQQQTGLLPEALTTYNRLLTLISDPTQKITVETEKSAIELLIAQSPNTKSPSSQPLVTPKLPSVGGDGPLLQADSGTGLIIAAPETSKDIAVSNLSSSNALSGTSTLPANQKQITVTNSNLTATSQVIVTATKGGKNLVLQVLGKSDKSFNVGFNSPASEDVEFKWWIVN